VSSGESYLLDTSAVLAFMEEEAGAARVEEILQRETVVLPFPVSLEVYYVTLQEQGEDRANLRYAMLRRLSVSHVSEIDEATLLTAGRLKAAHHLSVADAMIAAFAVSHDAVLVHKDPEFEPLRNVRQEALPYKSRHRVR